jgi:transposase-like protein
MKPQEQKTEFIRMRAEGRSYSKISNELHISKSTCTKWESELKEEINELKADQLSELYESYYMTREARIRRLGDTLRRIDDALSSVDLTEMPPEKLLDHKLKYTEALKEEYLDLTSTYTLKEGFEARDILDALGDLLNRIRTGTVPTEQARKESAVIGSLLKAYEGVELKAKIDMLEAVLEGRQI